MNRHVVRFFAVGLVAFALGSCGGSGTDSSATVGVGDLVITEIMFDPAAVSDENGEWFEIQNLSANTLDLMGLTIRDDGTDSLLIDVSLVVPAGGHVVLGRNSSLAVNGGVEVDFVYSGMLLGNTEDEIDMFMGSTRIDRATYGSGYPMLVGRALSLGLLGDHTHNDSPLNWCSAQSIYGSGDYGTPGSVNPVC